MRLTVAHSPDSDDAFMFYGLACGAVRVDGIEVDQALSDIETLNRCAFEGRYDVTAVSFHAYAHLADRYALLPHGASMGDKYGPILVARRTIDAAEGSGALKGLKIAIPGRLTSAHLVLQMFDPEFQADVMPFDRIQRAVLDGLVDAGLLIHEGQLTYADRGLALWQDLGAWWKSRTGLPLPLGGNVVRKDLGATLIHEISRDLRASIVYGLRHRTEALAHAGQYARGMDAGRTDTFVGMYVNDFTVDYGDTGRRAVQRLLDDAFAQRVIPNAVRAAFVDD